MESVNPYLYFDNASTTPCCGAAVQLFQHFATEDFGNPSSIHEYGQKSARAIQNARNFFAESFKVEPEQVIFTGSGSESDNLAITGVVTAALNQNLNPNSIRVIASSTEHLAVRKTVESLKPWGIECFFAPVDHQGQVREEGFLELITPHTRLISIQQVNQITGAILPVESLAKIAKAKNPELIFHTDAVQAFGKIQLPRSPSPVDLISISAHKVEGPKGVGALIVLNRKLLQGRIRPVIWGGEQEGGLRAGTQNAGLIAGFHVAAEQALKDQNSSDAHIQELNSFLKMRLSEIGLPIHWNSPIHSVPHIVSLSFPGIPSSSLAKLLEERRCLVSVGSACSSNKPEPDSVLQAMGLPLEVQKSMIRISFSKYLKIEDIETLVLSVQDSLRRIELLTGRPFGRFSNKRR
jgi:cysteine desulfurase